MISSSVVRGVVLAIIVLVALVAGLYTAALTWFGGSTPTTAVLRGGAAMGAVIALGITMWGFVYP